jgi:hypothetical protein
MELLKTTANPPYKERGGKVEFLRDCCCLYIDDGLNWEFYLNGEIEKGSQLSELKSLINSIVKTKEKRRRNGERERRIVIWTNNLTRIRVYIQLINSDLIPEFRT